MTPTEKLQAIKTSLENIRLEGEDLYGDPQFILDGIEFAEKELENVIKSLSPSQNGE